MSQTRSSSRAAQEVPANTQAPSRRGQHHTGEGVTWIILGFALCMLWALIITLQVQTSEAALNGTNQATSDVMQAQWTIWFQIPKLIFGDVIPGDKITNNNGVGVLLGQGIEIVFIGLLVGYEVAQHTQSQKGKILGSFARVCSFLICIFDFYSDSVYGNVAPGVHVMFAIFCSFVVAFALTWGIAMIESGYRRL